MSRVMFPRALAVALLVVAAVSTMMAQASSKEAQQPAVTFKSQSQLVLVPTIVTDHSGKPIEGLKAGNFTLLENGQERKIAMLEEVHAASTPVAPLQPGKGLYANHAGPQQARNVVIMVMDTINTPVTDQAYARQQMIKFLTKSVDGSALVSLMMLTQNGIKVIHDFTTDPKVLMMALRNLHSRHSAADDIAAATPIAGDSADAAEVAREETDLSNFAEFADASYVRLRRRAAIRQTLEALRLIGQAYAGVPGRKSLIWASGGFPFGLDDFETAFSGKLDPQSESASDMADLYRTTWRALNDANVSLYPVDVRGLVVIGYDASAPNPKNGNLNTALLRQSARHNEQIATFKTFADRTGGRAFINTNDLAASFRAAAADSSTYYMIGYYLDRGDPQPGWRKLEVKVDQKGARVRARSGFYVADESTQGKMSDAGLKAALASPLEYTGVPIVTRWTRSSPVKDSDKIRVEFQLFVGKGSFMIDEGDGNHCRLSLVAIAKKADGTVAAGVSDIVESRFNEQSLKVVSQKGLGYQKSFDVVPGEYTVRFLVRDDLSGRMGSVEAPLKVEAPGSK